ncbi:MAG: MBL fold metallo-hydrolase [Oligoflexus sp.]
MQNHTIKVWSVKGNEQWLDGGAMFGNAPKAVWQRWYEPDAASRIRLNCRSLLVELDGKKILCETGIGAYMEPKMRERYGVESADHLLVSRLASLGVQPDDIDYVILSHLHFDHAGGLLPAYGQWHEPITPDQLLFQNAQYVVGREAFQRAIKPHFRDRASFIPGLAAALKDSSRLQLVERSETISSIDPAIGYRFSDGHTPGQMHTVISGAKRKIIFAGDLIPGTAWVHLPITMGYDRFPEQLIDEKQDLYQTCVAEKWMIFLTHDPLVAACEVHCDESGRRYFAAETIEELHGLEL